MDSSRPFFEQLSGRFTRIVLFTLLLVSVLMAMLIVRDNQVAQLASQNVPLLAKQNERQKQILATYLSLENLSKRENAKEIAEEYELAQQQINDISLLVTNKKALLDLMFVGHKEFSGIIGTLSKNHDRNNQLKQNSIIQLQLLNDQLTTDIKDKQSKTNELLRQISNDKVTDKVTIVRAKAYTKLLNELSSLEKLQQTLIRALLAFQQLSFHTSILDFDDVSFEVKQVLTQFLSQKKPRNIEIPVLTQQLITLEQLLFSQQNTMAKWRSQLRLSRLYIEFIQQQQQKLQEFFNDYSQFTPALTTKNILLIDFVPQNINDWLVKQKIILNQQHLQSVIIIIVALSLLFLLNMIFRLKKQIKHQGIESVALLTTFIDELSTDKEDKLSSNQLNCAENKTIADRIANNMQDISRPEHTEKEYQQQVIEQHTAIDDVSKKVDEIAQLQESINLLKSANIEQKELQYTLENQVNDKLSNMVVRTMLQSQSVSIGSGVTSLQVYRQLTRIFDWCRQSKIRSEFLSPSTKINLSDVALHHEIDAALLNIMNDAHFQRNQIFYQQDVQLLTQAKIDLRLFHRMFNGVCRLMLADLFKASLHISSHVIDKNEGQHIVRFDFSVVTHKKVTQLPDVIDELLSITDDKAENDTSTYLLVLLKALHVSEKNAQLQENGYQFSLTLPFAFSDHSHQSKEDKYDLQQANICVLTGDENIRSIVNHAIVDANGQVENLVAIDREKGPLSTQQLLNKKVDVVIVANDSYATLLDDTTHYISNLESSLQPKVFVMQPSFNASLHRHGLFEQAANPLQIPNLQRALHTLLTTSIKSNLILDSSALVDHQYLPTQVEVLFAVREPAKHQSIIRLLQWLGLQVQVVCQPTAMDKFWKSGRYLLLFTEFEQSPCIDLSVGKGIRRGIFTFADNLFIQESSEAVADQWLFAEVPELSDIDKLVALLQPWLKAKSSKTTIIEKSPGNKEINRAEQSKVVLLQEQQVLQAAQTSEKLDKVLSELDLTPVVKNVQEQVFDLDKYAKNQGSAELAVLMLDDYIDDINQGMSELSHTIDEQNYSQGIDLLMGLIKVSSIIAAEDFCDLCQQLQAALNDEKTTIVALFTELENQQQLLNQFAEAI
jgi:hypothetical protein